MRYSRIVARVSLITVSVVLVLVFVAVVFVRDSFPRISGRDDVDGLGSGVTLTRDRHGIVHVDASEARDLYFAQGYAHAQDRLWQMEFQRRVASGRTAEIFGEEFVSTDAFLRRMGLPEISRLAVENASPEGRAVINAYVDGVNAYIDSGPRPLELRILGVHPEPWTPADVGGVLALMGFDLGLNWEIEATRQAMLGEVGQDAMSEILPPYEVSAPPIWTAEQASAAEYSSPATSAGAAAASHGDAVVQPAVPASRAEATLASRAESTPAGVIAETALTPSRLAQMRSETGIDKLGPLPRTGSNSWVLGPERTEEGVAQLANDPHLSLGLPSLWYEMELEYGDDHWVRGFSIPGAPTIVVGHNRDVAWGLTNTGDTQDLFLELRHESQPELFERDGQWREAEITTDHIPVSGRYDPEEIEIVRTANGPIITEEPYFSVHWTAYDMERSPFDAFLGMNSATDVYEFRDSLIHFELPAQNVVFADTEGNIGFRTVGLIPAREKRSGMLPQPGWDSERRVPDVIPFEELPELINPPQGYIATANHLVTDDTYPYYIHVDTAPWSRMQRIVDVIDQNQVMSSADSRALQVDWQSPHAGYWAPQFVAAVEQHAEDNSIELGEAERSALDVLSEWNETPRYERDSAGPVIFAHWYLEAMESVFRPRLGDELYEEFLETGYYLVFNSMDSVLQQEESLWVDVDPNALLADTFSRTIQSLVDRFGADIASWRWEDVQQIELAHTLAEVPGLSLLLNRGPYPYGGGHLTVGRAAYEMQDPFNVTDGAGVRMVVSLEDTPVSHVAHVGGQSGHPGNRWYADQFEAWRNGSFRQVEFFSRRERDSDDGAQFRSLRLRPR